MLVSPTTGPRHSRRRPGATWLAIWLIGGAACGGSQRANDEPTLVFADPEDCSCTVTADDLEPRPGQQVGAPPPGAIESRPGQRPGEGPGEDAAAPPREPRPDAATIATRYARESDASQPPRWTGRRIDFNVKDADLPNVLRLLSEVGEVDMVIADDVTGTVTLRLGNVPWDQALDAVIRLERLSVRRNGRILVIRRGP